jgi:hypothetical protein
MAIHATAAPRARMSTMMAFGIAILATTTSAQIVHNDH